MQISRCSSSEMSEMSEVSEISEISERSEISEISERSAIEGRANNCSATIGYLGQAISYLSLIITLSAMDEKCENFNAISGFYLAGVCSEILSTIFLIHSMVPSYIKFANEEQIPKKNFPKVWWISGKYGDEDATGKYGGKNPTAEAVFVIPLYITGNLMCTIAMALFGLYARGCDEVLANHLAGPNLEE